MVHKQSQTPDIRRPPVLLATWFGSGLLPGMPGTWGSLAALPAAWLIQGAFGWIGLGAASLAVFMIGVVVSNAVIGTGEDQDPGLIVIDEVAGQWLTLLPVAGAISPDPVLYGMGFVLFRLFDILKPWPVSWADAKIKGGLGVMLDDVLAALYAGALLYGFSLWWGS